MSKRASNSVARSSKTGRYVSAPKTGRHVSAPTSAAHPATATSKSAESVDAWLDALDPAETPADDTRDLRAVADAADAVARANAKLREAVEIAHAKGRSWARIGVALGVTRQAARERFAPDLVSPDPDGSAATDSSAEVEKLGAVHTLGHGIAAREPVAARANPRSAGRISAKSVAEPKPIPKK